MMKKCPKCGVEKSLLDFYKNSANKDGLGCYCKKCSDESSRKSHAAHPERVKLKNQAYRSKNADKVRLATRKWAKNNPEKTASYARSWKERNPDKVEGDRLKRRFNISLEEYRIMHDAQRGLCAICNLPESGRHSAGKICKLSVDHDHKTGRVRGLLCHNCNRGIGNLHDDPEILLKAASYVALQGAR